MPKLPRTSAKRIISALKRMGFEHVRTKGSHVIMKKTNPYETVGCVIPMHSEVAVGTLKSILKQAKIDPNDFSEHL